MPNGKNSLPDNIKDLPWQVQMAVLYERVQNLDDRVKTLTRSLWAGIGTLITGMLLYLFSVSSGWIGPQKQTSTLGEVIAWVHAGLGSVFSLLLGW